MSTLPLPDVGQRIRCHLKNGDVITGKVQHVWMAMDEPCINVWYHGAVIQVFAGLGDTWEPATDNGLSTLPDEERKPKTRSETVHLPGDGRDLLPGQAPR